MIKKLWKSKAVRVWSIVSAIVLILFIVITCVATGVKDFYELLNMVMPGGGPRAVLAKGIDPIYLSDYDSKKEVYSAARDMNQTICEEGFVLLKNENNALPLSTADGAKKISVFGKNSVNIAYGGSGSGGANTSNVIDLYQGLKNAGYEYNPTLYKFYNDNGKSGPVRKGNSSDLDSGATAVLSTAETPQDKYTDAVKNSYAEYNKMALIVITRIGGEGFDIPRTMKGATGYRNEDDHFLQLDKNEEDLIAAVCEANFERVVLVLNTGNAMEVGFLKNNTEYVTSKGYKINPDKIDAAIWMGFPGETGTNALGRVLNGEVNPSGRLADTYVVDLKKDPTWFNFGDNRLGESKDASGKITGGGDRYEFGKKLEAEYYFVDYEESVYVGYRYYETRFGGNESEYVKNVVYPFGYGMSYTTFEWTLKDASKLNNVAIEQGKKYDITVTVRNTGKVAGKDVVQVYGHAPYTPGGIEKPEEVLLDFAKTPLLYPVSEANGTDKPNSVDLTLTVDPYYLASYDYTDANNNKNKGYELEAGNDYAVYISHDAHNKFTTVPFKVTGTINYTKDPVTKKDVVNRYTDSADKRFDSVNANMTLLSRNDWEGTFPETPTEAERNGSEELLTWLQDKSHNNPENLRGVDMPLSEEENGMKLRDMLYDDDGEPLNVDKKGVPFADYDDPRWEDLLDQASVDSLIRMYNYASYHIEAVSEIGLPRINCADGPVGWACFMDKNRFYSTCSFCSQTLVATTWSKEVAEQFGVTIGNEGIIGNAKGDRSPYSGWYAPGANIHRSAFGGRNFEYYAEDGVLSGKMAAAQIKGCNSKGVFTFIKHFAANEQETHRSITGDISWLSEQALREIYLRPFEIAVKEGESHAVMTSFNRIGTRWTGGDYRLLTNILRDEWGFKGVVLCDFNTIPAYMNSRQMAYAGGDLNLATQPKSWCDSSSSADVTILRRCAKNALYAVVNSNAMNHEVIGYDLPLWVVMFIVLDCLLAVGAAVWGFFVIRKALKSDGEPATTTSEASSGETEAAADNKETETETAETEKTETDTPQE